ncbi:MFS transporter [Sphingorhabdus sp. M41]|uniref:MFS transporter n=1 Tax=Sphingorhabdus sp. M41 TaxID=1806885 RepID=UPI00078D0442|nr:MFS transporter [Sphingorhabdus sp. M41]AMO72575.1 hypothetical protein AZE99_12595 [Sphingorhabdus sp. M41]
MNLSPTEQDDVRFQPNLAKAWFAVILLCLAQIISTIDRGMLALVVDPIRAELGISDVQIALLQGLAFSIFYVIAGIALGLVADVVNRKRLLIAGIVVWSAATVASGVAETFGQMFAARLFIGIGEAVLAPCAVTIIADLFPVSRRGKPMALYVFGSMIAFGVGSLVTGYILAAAPQGAFDWIGFLENKAPWRIAFILAGIAGIILAAVFTMIDEPKRNDSKVIVRQTNDLRDSLQAMLANWKLYLPVYATLAFFGMGISVVINWSPMLLTRVFEYKIEDVSKMLGMAHIIWAAIGALTAGFVVDRAVKRWGSAGLIYLASMVSLLAIPSTLAIFTNNGLFAIILLSEVTFASALFGSAMLSAIAEISPKRTRGLSVAFYAFSMTLIGASTGPLLVAFITEYLFASEQAVGLSIAIVGSVAFGGAALLAFVSGSKLVAITADSVRIHATRPAAT